MARDPVCGMEIEGQEGRYGAQYMGENFSFCSEDCKTKFEGNPQKYSDAMETPVSTTRKVVIVGTGQVGATICFSLMTSGLASSIVLIDLNPDLAEGHAMDLNDGLSFVQPVRIFAGNYSDCKGADIVVVTAGAAQKPEETRLDLVSENTRIFRDIIPRIVAHEPGILLIVSNPVDILTYVALKVSEYPMNRVIGSGTTLDTARFRFLLSRHCQVDPRNVHAYIIGEHGDSEVPVWSQANIAGLTLSQYCSVCERSCLSEEREEIFRQVKNAAYEIINRKGYTNFAIALAVVRIIISILRDENSVLTVSTLVDDYHGISNVCLSIPAILNMNGVSKHIHINLDDSERRQLLASAETLKGIIGKLDI
ncbi:MAG: L-lactate dehydrogenase [Deltaproteobacteria bacterium]|nr:L-lactate dehydrogenase [Deltaproteobacteria bacterium]